MAIAPETLDRQRGLAVVREEPAGKKREGFCAKCGDLTSAKSGICRACHNGYGLPDVRRLPTDRILAYAEALRAELTRRRDELNAALNEREGT
jgi:hypothetical protein